MKANSPPPALLLLLLLLLPVNSAFWLSAPDDSRQQQLSLELTQTVLRHRKVINIRDVIDRQLLYTLGTSRHEQFVFESSNELPPYLFATVVPCLSPIEFEFRKFAGSSTASRPVKSRSLDPEFFSSDGEEASLRDNQHLVSRHSATLRLETASTKALSIRLGAFGNYTAAMRRLGSTKALIKLSTRYPSIELGTSRYNLQVCDPGGSETTSQVVKIRVSHLMSAARQLDNRLFVCIVVNSIRPLHQYCAAQIGLGGVLPYPHEGLLEGSERYVLPVDTYAYNCTSYTSLWSQEPLVNVSRILASRDPSRLYINAFLVWPGSDGQAESVAWQTSTYYRKDPKTGAPQSLVSCNQQFYVESTTELLPVPGTDNGVYEAAVSVQMPPNTSLLVRPSRLDMVGSAYRVEITPYSGQSDSFAVNAANFSCNDSVWAYGGVVCGRDKLHTCLPGDNEACRYDSVRLIIRLEHKIKNRGQPGHGPTRHRRDIAERWSTQPRQVQWQFVHLANAQRQDVVQPRIGRVDEAIQLLKVLWQSTEMIRVGRIGSDSDAHRAQVRRRQKTLQVCNATLNHPVFHSSSERLIQESAKCYKKLLQLHMHAPSQCNTSTSPFRVQIASLNTSMFTAPYTPASNGYLCLVFELRLVLPLQNRIKKLRETHGDTYQFSKAYKRIERHVETRLLSTVSTLELPTNENQGFGTLTSDSQQQLRRVRHQMMHFEKDEPIESMELIYKSQSAPGNNHPDFAPRIGEASLNRLDPGGSRMFAIYIYAIPSERLRRVKVALSLFAFRLHSLDEMQRIEYNCESYRRLRQDWKWQKRQRRQEKRRRRKQKRRQQRQKSRRRRPQRKWRELEEPYLG